MNERIKGTFSGATTFWQNRTGTQRLMLIGIIALILVSAGIATYFATRTNFVPAWEHVSAQEAGQLQAALEAKGATSKITPEANGLVTVSVPEGTENSLKVALSAEGLPNSGGISYGDLLGKTGYAMSEKELQIAENQAKNTAVQSLIKSMDGITDAIVIITPVEQSVFSTPEDGAEGPTASVVLKTQYGKQFDEQQIKGIYNLISKSVAGLSPENISIMDQNGVAYDPPGGSEDSGDVVMNQFKIKKAIEKNVQQKVQNMLGLLMGQDKVMAVVDAQIDFDQKKEEQEIFEPVDKENMKGIARSAQDISETYDGNGAASAVAGTGTNEIANYPGGTDGESGKYEKLEKTINYEVNRIKREINNSPYKITDLSIQVMAEPTAPKTQLDKKLVDNIKTMLGTVIKTNIDNQSAGQLTAADFNNRVNVISDQQFNGKPVFATPGIPMWVYILAGVALLLIITGVIFFILRRRKKVAKEEAEEFIIPHIEEEIDEIEETESTTRRKQLEKMAYEKPEDFARLLRTWIAED